MKIVIGNYSDPTDSRNLILNDEVSFSTNNTAPTSVMMALISKVTGIETAPFRNGTGDWSGADGGYISAQFYSARTITISGTYIDRRAGCDFSAETTEQFDHIARLYIRSRLPIRTKQKIRIFMDSGMTFYTEGYCTDIQMDYTFVGHGDYQISMYCPDPGLYRGSSDGSIGTEWHSATLRKANNTGYVSSGTDSLGDPYYTVWEKNDGSGNSGVVWGTGGRTNVIEYEGDYPYYPQFILSPSAGKYIQNPVITSVTTKQSFGLGYPDTRIAQFAYVDEASAAVTFSSGDNTSADDSGTDNTAATASLVILDEGAFYNDCSGTYTLLAYSSTQGAGAKAKVTMEKDENTDYWHVSEVELVEEGEGYESNDVLTFVPSDQTILLLSSGDECVIDMAEHTVTVNGDSVAYYIAPGSEWFKLQAMATNNITFSSSSDDDEDFAIIRWRDGYNGI